LIRRVKNEFEAGYIDKLCWSGFVLEQLQLLHLHQWRRCQTGKVAIEHLNLFAGKLGKDTALAVEATGNTFILCRELK
jgi:hypothetical protein